MPELAIRAMRREDLDRVMEIEKLSFSLHWTREDFEQELESTAARYCVLTKDAVLAGFAGMWLTPGEAHITNIAVHPDFRRHGYAKRLLLYLMRAALEVDTSWMTLEVRSGNSGAQTLYRKLGFHKIGVRKGYYEDTGEDAFVMLNDLLPETLEKHSGTTLRLKRSEGEDIPSIREILSAGQNSLWPDHGYTSPFFSSPPTAEQIIAYRANQPHSLFFSVCRGDTCIGSLELKMLCGKQFLLSHFLLKNEMRSQGYGSRILEKTALYAFDVLGAKTLHLFVHNDNTSAIRCFEKVGFTKAAPADDKPLSHMVLQK